jgi:hypothetical protein
MLLTSKKKRKPRGIKKNGHKSYDLCPCCFSPGCDPMANTPKFNAMVRDRLSRGVCVACNHKPCTCKSSKKP